ncbi:MAG: hypothetical protein EAZ24_08750 [Burkholderiales bacterium]|nr:MAG: hypothetical protein EAZ24_08750 [Burkholderiales bacterium]TAG80649.1 MAG: hypothetical protein EAZ21_07865 [Betaproteobacteria bacterium]
MRDLIARLGATPNLIVYERAASWELHLSKTEHLTIVVTIPHDTLEWFAIARASGREVWTDWADYYATNGETTESLRAYMASDIEHFVHTLSRSEVRVTALSKPRKHKYLVEWKQHDAWRLICMSPA